MNIYIASSWKNRDRVRRLAEQLQAVGHQVYDFTNPTSRKGPTIPPEANPAAFDPADGSYAAYLRSRPEWRLAVLGNLEAIRGCDAAVLLLPAGADSHADWGAAVGLGKLTVVVGHPPAGERTPSHLWASAMLASDEEVAGFLPRPSADCGPRRSGVGEMCCYGTPGCETEHAISCCFGRPCSVHSMERPSAYRGPKRPSRRAAHRHGD